jgi:hypothetical protein
LREDALAGLAPGGELRAPGTHVVAPPFDLFDPAARSAIAAAGATPFGIGPVSVHADDAITIASSELDRPAARATSSEPGRGP